MGDLGKKLLFAACLFANAFCWAQSMEGVKVLEVSSSKKSILINRGYAENLRNGDRSKIYVKDLSQGFQKPRFIYVGEGEVIKVKNNVSYWYLRKIKSFRYLNKNQDLVIVRQAKDPRRPFVTRRSLKIQGRGQDQDYYEVTEDKGVPEDLIFEEQDFLDGRKMKDTKTLKRQDIELSKKTKYIETGEEYDEEFEQLAKNMLVPASEDDDRLIEAIEKMAEDRAFDSTTTTSVPKYNNLKYGLKSLYKGNVREPGLNIAVKDSIKDMRAKQIEANEERKNLSPGAIARIRKEGPRFSRDMTDEQLRRYLVQTGIAEEIRRQKRALEEKMGQEFTLRYITNLQSNASDEGGSFNGVDYALGASYEWHLGNTLKSLKDFTLEVGLERAISFVDAGGLNVRITEGSLQGYVNWYFLHPPSSLYKYMPYIGGGFKRGNGTIQGGDLSQDYSTQVFSLPSAHFGLKYRWSSGDESQVAAYDIGYGANVQLKYENSRYNISEFLEDDINSVFSVNQLRLSIGFNVYF